MSFFELGVKYLGFFFLSLPQNERKLIHFSLFLREREEEKPKYFAP